MMTMKMMMMFIGTLVADLVNSCHHLQTGGQLALLIRLHHIPTFLCSATRHAEQQAGRGHHKDLLYTMRLSQEEDGDSLEDPGAPGHYVVEDYDFTELYSRFTGFEDVSCDVCTYSTARMGNMRRHVLAVHQGV